MSRATFEICLDGEAPADLLRELNDATQSPVPVQTVLVTAPVDPDALHRLVLRIRDLGLELRGLRRLTARHGGSRARPDGGGGAS